VAAIIACCPLREISARDKFTAGRTRLDRRRTGAGSPHRRARSTRAPAVGADVVQLVPRFDDALEHAET
jgi:hypothetical protein